MTQLFQHRYFSIAEKYPEKAFRRMMRKITGIFNLEVPLHVEFSEFYRLTQSVKGLRQAVCCGLRTQTLVKDVWLKQEDLEMNEDVKGVVYGKDDYVQTNIILLCDKGCLPTPFIATPKTQNHHGITGGTIRDNLPLLNILPFGVCTVTRYPCIPVMPIWDDYPKKPWYIEGFQPLLLSSCALCQLGGTIKIYTSYFEAYAAMREISKSWKDKLLDAVDDAIGSALLSPVAPILKMCGLGGAVKSVGEFGRGFVTGVAKGLAGTFEAENPDFYNHIYFFLLFVLSSPLQV